MSNRRPISQRSGQGRFRQAASGAQPRGPRRPAMLPRHHMSDTQSLGLNSAALGIGRHVSGIADPFNGHMDEFRIAHVQRSDG